jgi:hypothetical protein
VAIEIQETKDELIFDGTWNGSRTNFRVTANSLPGTIVVDNLPTSGPAARPYSMSAVSCQYVLDRVLPDGSRAGISTCGSLPEETLLEIPPVVLGWLTRAEMVVVVLALLSTPPRTAME